MNDRSRWIWWVIGLALAALLGLLASPARAQADMPQRADQHINDFASVIASADRATLAGELGALLRERGVELVVVTIGSPDDYGVKDQSFEAFATELFNRWGIGDRRRNDGVLLLVAVRDRKVRIEMGSGYGAAYDAAMQQVIARDIVPQFREEQYSAGIVAGVRGIQAALAGAPAADSTASASPAWGSPVVWLGVGVAAVGVLGTAYAFRRSLRGPRRRCSKCGGVMRQLGDSEAQARLSKGQRAEQSLGAATYTVWACRSCGDPEIERTLRHSSGLTECPSCHNYALKSRAAGVTQQGKGKRRQRLQRIERSCQFCSYSDHRTETLAAAASASQFTASNSSYDSSSSSYSSSSSSSYDSSSSSYDSGGSSFDSGGSSSGDGASGSW